MRTLTLLAATLAITACKPANEAKPLASGSVNYAAQVATLPEPARNAVFFRAIHDAGLPCQHIIDSRPMANTPSAAVTWRAQCEDKAYHLIRIQPDGSAAVTSRITP